MYPISAFIKGTIADQALSNRVDSMTYFMYVYVTSPYYLRVCSLSGLMRKVDTVTKLEVTCIFNNLGFSSRKFTWLIPLLGTSSANSRDQN